VGNLQPERRKSLAFSPVSFNRLPSRFVPTIPNHLPTATSLGLRVISCPRKRIAATMLAATNRAPVGVVSCANTPDFALASLERNPTHNNDRPTHSTCIRVRTNSGVAIEPRPSRVLIADHEQMPRLRNDRSDTISGQQPCNALDGAFPRLCELPLAPFCSNCCKFFISCVFCEVLVCVPQHE
jgi:hypothetical protein